MYGVVGKVMMYFSRFFYAKMHLDFSDDPVFMTVLIMYSEMIWKDRQLFGRKKYKSLNNLWARKGIP